jgi:hypothetical protein
MTDETKFVGKEDGKPASFTILVIDLRSIKNALDMQCDGSILMGDG